MTPGNLHRQEHAGLLQHRALSDSHASIVRLCYALIIAGMPLAFTACSYVTDLVVRNHSDQPIVVTLTPVRGDPRDPSCACPDGFVYEGLGLVATIDEHEFKSVEWTPLEAGAFRYDSAGTEVTLTISVVVPPNASFRVGRAGAAGSKLLGVASVMTLEIEAAGIRQRLTARDIRDRFRPVLHRAVYVYDVGT